jgi:hypothetical protein
MFDNSYPITRLFSKNIKNNKYLKNKTTYSFNIEKSKYLIEVEEYKCDVFIIKFCLASQKNNTKRFNMLTGQNKVGSIVATCIQVILQVLKRNNEANFGFIGSHTFDPKRKYEEKKECTKRFKIYRYAVYNLIGEESFTHFMEERNSTYLLVNNKLDNVDNVKNAANKMFDTIFPTLRDI